MSSPKGLERNASRGYRRHQPDANRHDQREGHLDRPLGPVVREDALVEKEDGYPGACEAEGVKQDAVLGGMSDPS